MKLKPLHSDTAQRTALTLDIDHFVAQEKGVEVSAAIDWVEEVHDRVEKVFEGCITHSLRSVFQEVRQ